MKGTKPKIVVIIQARMGSTRLPGKTMMDLGGEPLLGRLLDQLKGSKTVDEVVVATTTEPSDDLIETFVVGKKIRVIRGSSQDVLGRYVLAAKMAQADVIVRLTADCPLHSPDTVDEVVRAFQGAKVDYVSNTNPYTRPDGQDVEVFTTEILKKADKIATDKADREHATLWIRRSPEVSRLNYQHLPPHEPSMRWSVDYPDDLEFARSVWLSLGKQGRGPFCYKDILSVIKTNKFQNGKSVINEGLYLSVFESADSEPAPSMPLQKSFEWLERSEKVVPGGAQTYSKSWRHHIRGVTPVFLESGRGAVVTDVDGNRFVDLIQGLLPNILGYAHDEVNQAAFERANHGHSFSLAHPIEVELAERLCRLIPCAEMVRFGKNGSDATAGAVRVARAFTQREHVAVCGYHGWQDWFIGTTSRSAGVPQAVRDLAHPFPYNDPAALEALLSSKPNQFAAVIMEPANFIWPDPGYLEKVKEITHRHKALFIFDEICSGFHFGLGGAQKLFGVTPDLATFGKAMGNGWPISCVVGRREVMKTFEDAFVSFTFAGDVSAMAAAMKVLDNLEFGDAYARMTAAGIKLFDGARVMAKAAGLENAFRLKGHHHWPIFSFVGENGADDPATRALWVQEVTRRGVLLLTTFNISAALDEAAVIEVLKAFAHGFKRVAKAKKLGIKPESWLGGPVPVPAFRVRE